MELREGQFRLVDDRIGRVEAGILREIPDLDAPGDGNLAGIGLELADEHLKERGFPAPVGPDEADALAAARCSGSSLSNMTRSPKVFSILNSVAMDTRDTLEEREQKV